MNAKPACDINRQKTAGIYWYQESVDTQCQLPEPINREEEDIPEVQQFQHLQILQPVCQAQEMDKSLDMRPKRKIIRYWTKEKKLEKHKDMNLVRVNPAAVVQEAQQQNLSANEHRVAELRGKKGGPHQNNLRKYGPNQLVKTLAVHLTGPALMLEKYYAL